MRFHFFSVPVAEPGPAAAELNTFLATHRVVAVERELVHDGPRSAWAVCVTVAGSTPERADDVPAPGQPRVDYKAVLPPDQFEVFVRLRALRKTVAERDGVPPYGVFNNEQLAEMVRRPVRTRAQLAAIPGVGPARVEKYGAAFLEALHQSAPHSIEEG